MKRRGAILLFLFPTLFLYSCAKTIIPANFGEYQPKAIQLYLKSDPQLHLYQGIPHTLVFCVYNLIDPMEFSQLLDEKGGLEKLCECTKFHPSVTSAKRFIIHPDRIYTEVLDRPANAKYVGVVAGYYQLEKENVARQYSYPVIKEKTWRTITEKPGILNINLYLGPEEIKDIRGNVK
jgi:predicted component of type VI protein secretion system